MKNDKCVKFEDGEGEPESATEESEKSQQASFWTTRKKLVGASLCIVVFTAFASLSIISPFFPNVALKKGASHSVVGLIFSVYPLVGIVMSPVYGKLMPRFGAKNVLLTGLLIEGITTILFGFVPLMPDGPVFIVCCFLLRIIDALGSAGCETAAFVIIAQEFPDNVGSIMGVLDTFTGVGLMAGPPLGGILYTALKKGASHSVVGLIFSVYPLVGIVMSPVYGKLMPRFGAKNVLLTGLLIEGITTILFGFVPLMPDGPVFIVCCFLLRIIDALGSAGCETAAFVIIAQKFPDNVGSIMGVLDTFTGVGLMAGPPLGGILYTAGGFKLPFIVMGVLELLTVITLVFSLPSAVENEQGEEQQSFLKTLKIPAVVIMAISAIMGGMNLTYLDPILSPYLSHFGPHGLSVRTIGFIFLIPSALYATLSPATGWIGDKTKKYYLMIMLGFFLTGIGFMLIGPMPFFDSVLPQRKVWLACVGLVLLGISFALLLVPIMPEMLQVAKRNGMPEDVSTTGIMSGIYGSAMNCGAFIGPMMAGAVTGRLGFKWATGILAFILFFQVIVLVIFYIYNTVKRRSDPEKYSLNDMNSKDREPLLP